MTFQNSGSPSTITIFSYASKFLGEDAYYSNYKSILGVHSEVTISRLKVPLDNGGNGDIEIDSKATLMLYIGDMSISAAKVNLADLVRMNGTRSLNIRRESGESVKVMLKDTAGTLSKQIRGISMELSVMKIMNNSFPFYFLSI